LRDGSAALFARIIQLSMRKWREEAGYTQKDAAKRLDRTVQHISNLETKRLPGQSDMEVLLLFYAKDERIPFMCELLRAARKKANWWKAFSGAVPEWFDLFLALESGATEISSYDAMVVPGLLQVTPYARAIMRGNPDLEDEEVERRVDLRGNRQREILHRTTPPHVWTVLDEAALRRTRGDKGTMLRQYKHLLEISDMPRLDIQVLPLNAGAVRADGGGTFTLMKFPPEMLTDQGVVYLELLTNGLFIEDPKKIVDYGLEMARLRARAADQKTSRDIINKVMKEVT
jgi:transcriptional regulator with XRE-family HTH domain